MRLPHSSPRSVLADPRPQHFGDDDAAVGLLVVLQDRDQRPREGDRGAVERVDEPRALLLWRLVADVEPAGLEVGAVRRAGHLAVFARSRRGRASTLRGRTCGTPGRRGRRCRCR